MAETGDWRRLAAELEDKVASLSAALAEVQGTLRSLTDMAAQSESALAAPAEYKSPVSELVSLMSAEPKAFVPAEPAVSQWEQEPVAYETPASYEAPASWITETPTADSPGSWPTGPSAETTEVEQPDAEAVETPLAAEWSSPPNEWAWESPTAVEEEPVEHAALEDVEEIAAPIEPVDVDEARDDVRRAVEALRAELEADSSTKSRFGWYEPASADAAVETKGAVGQDEPVAAASLETGAPEADDEDARREEVRRAVEMARAELMGVVAPPEDDEDSGLVGKALAPGALSEQFRFEGPGVVVAQPTIVLEDQEGRVELVRIFETLSRVQCADQAVLLNYQPHSVTVGIAAKVLPPADELAAAVKDVFGRTCQVKEEKSSNRLSVQIANQHEGWPKAS